MRYRRLAFLALICAIAMLGYMLLGAKGSWSFLLPFRGAKLAALALVSVAISTSTVLFQTIAGNRILTPSIMGFDALYVLIVTLAVFFLGMQGFFAIPDEVQYLAALMMLVGMSLLLFGTLLLQARVDLMRMILTGLVMAALFRSLNSFAIRMIDPNEYSAIQVSSYARFSLIETDLLALSAILILGALALVWRMRHRLDILALGRDAAINLGEDPRRGTLQALVLIAVLVSASTAFVGPIAFLGLIVVSLARSLIRTETHASMLIAAGLTSMITLVGGQTILERVFGLITPLGVFVDLIGGLFFLMLILREMRA